MQKFVVILIENVNIVQLILDIMKKKNMKVNVVNNLFLALYVKFKLKIKI